MVWRSYSRTRWLFVFVGIFMLAGLVVYINGHRYQLRRVLFHREVDPKRFTKRIDAFLAWDHLHVIPLKTVLFIGSSSIAGWATNLFFPTLPTLNRGFGGSHISDVIYYLNQIVFPYHPKVIVFYAGDNDIAGGKSPERVLSDFQRFVERTHEKLPDTQIVFLPIKPSIRRWQYWPAMRKANAMIKAYTEQDSHLHYIDTVSPMLNDYGLPLSNLFVEDGLHLNQKGYEIWTNIVTPYIEKLLKSD